MRERRHSEDEALTGAAWGRILALGERWWCCDDIFRAAVRVIDEYQMLSITPWEKLMKQKKTTPKDNEEIRAGRRKKRRKISKCRFNPGS